MMNPGVSREVGNTARAFIESVKAQPLALALVVMNFALIGTLYWFGEKQAALRSHDIELCR